MPGLNTPEAPNREIHLRDGRTLGYAEYGDPAGIPVFFFHGTPGSRLQHCPDDSITASACVRLISIDRPGYGLSTFQPNRRLLDWPDDVAQLADALHIERFAVIGLSGGGPHALACAYKMPERLTNVVIVSGIGPLDALRSYQGMPRSTRLTFTVARHVPWQVLRLIHVSPAWQVHHSPQQAKKHLPRSAPPADKAVFARPDMLTMDQKDLIEAYRSGVDGVSWDSLLLLRPWGFCPEDIRKKIYLWHGEEDTIVPVAMARYMTQALPVCQATFIPDEGHTLLFNYWREILALAIS
jgi:pimeloyl-ACP methyl ester carboxylesterase